MEINILLAISITILFITIISVLAYLIFYIHNIKNRIDILSLEMVDFHEDVDYKQIDSEKGYRDCIKEMNTSFDVLNRKIDKQHKDIVKHYVPRAAEEAAEKHITKGIANFINTRANSSPL